MPLVPAKCPSCGASLTIDSANEATICEYCGTPFVTEKAISNYSITDSVVYIHNEAEKKKEFEIVAGTLIRYNGEGINIKLPTEVVKIGNGCFQNMPIESIEFHDQLISIDDRAFNGCIKLKKAILPDSLQELGNIAFSGCSNLEEVKYPGSIRKCPGNTFEECRKLKKITIGNGISYIPSDFARNCDSLVEVNIPDSVTEIGTWAFYSCSSLCKIDIPDSVYSICQEAFARCSSLTQVNMSPEIVRQIGQRAFHSTPWQEAEWKKNNCCRFCGEKLILGICFNCFNKND